MSNNSREYNVSNDHLLLIGILNSMYNDNIRQINNLSESIHLLNDANTEIRNLLTQILYTNMNRRNQFYRPNSSRLNSFRQHMQSNVRSIPAITGFYDFPTNENRNENENIYRTRNERTNTSRTNLHVNRNTNTTPNLSHFWQNFFQPVSISPTQVQIEAATRTVQYVDIVSPINRACPISLENFNDTDIVTIIRFCTHIFNRDEISTWFSTNCMCPVCRYDIRTYQSNIYTERHDNSSESREPSDSENLENQDVSETNQPFPHIRDADSSIVFDFYLDNNFFRDISGNSTTNNTTDISLLSSLLNNAMNNRPFR